MQPASSMPQTVSRGDLRRGILAGLAPLARLVALVALTLVLTAIARTVTASLGFFAQQQVSVLVFSVGLLLGIAVYIVSCVRLLRRIAVWQRYVTDTPLAAGALWTLAVSAVLVLLPFLLAILLPQHPAP